MPEYFGGRPAANPQVITGPRGSSLADVVDLILDKGLVIDIYVNVQLVGIDLLTINARIVIASVDTYLRFAEAVLAMNEKYDMDMPIGGVKRRRDGQGKDLGEALEGTVGGVGRGLGDAVEGTSAGVGRAGGTAKASGAGSAVKEIGQSVKDVFTGDDDEEEERPRQKQKVRR